MALHEIRLVVRLDGMAADWVADTFIIDPLRAALPGVEIEILDRRMALRPDELTLIQRKALREAKVPPEHAGPEDLMGDDA